MPDLSRRIRDAAGLLAHVPTMLKFQPNDSLVVLVMSSRQVVLTVRLDLADTARADLIPTLATAIGRAQGDRVVLVAYRDELGQDLVDLLARVSSDLELAHLTGGCPRVEVLDCLMVGATTWRSIWRDDEEHPRAELETHPVHVEDVADGHAPARSRAELAARLEPGSDPGGDTFLLAAEAALAAVLGMSDKDVADLAGRFLDRYERDWALPDDAVLGALLALVSVDAGMRVALARLRRDDADAWLALWGTVVRRSVGTAAYGPLVLAGAAAWLTGDGASMNVCLTHAEPRHPGHWGAALLARINEEAIPPSQWSAALAHVPT